MAVTRAASWQDFEESAAPCGEPKARVTGVGSRLGLSWALHKHTYQKGCPKLGHRLPGLWAPASTTGKE